MFTVTLFDFVGYIFNNSEINIVVLTFKMILAVEKFNNIIDINLLKV